MPIPLRLSTAGKPIAGPIMGNQSDSVRCRNTLVVQIPDRERAFKAVKGIQNHYVAAVGDHRRALIELAETKDIEVVRLDRPQGA